MYIIFLLEDIKGNVLPTCSCDELVQHSRCISNFFHCVQVHLWFVITNQWKLKIQLLQIKIEHAPWKSTVFNPVQLVSWWVWWLTAPGSQAQLWVLHVLPLYAWVSPTYSNSFKKKKKHAHLTRHTCIHTEQFTAVKLRSMSTFITHCVHYIYSNVSSVRIRKVIYPFLLDIFMFNFFSTYSNNLGYLVYFNFTRCRFFLFGLW